MLFLTYFSKRHTAFTLTWHTLVEVSNDVLVFNISVIRIVPHVCANVQKCHACVDEWNNIMSRKKSNMFARCPPLFVNRFGTRRWHIITTLVNIWIEKGRTLMAGVVESVADKNRLLEYPPKSERNRLRQIARIVVIDNAR